MFSPSTLSLGWENKAVYKTGSFDGGGGGGRAGGGGGVGVAMWS